MPEPDCVLMVILYLWFTLAGTCVGSFLNVLVYRLPRHKSIVHPPSHCPHCGHPIRWYDNVPVLGWIQLRGKCRDCRLPISVRYPCIEGFCGVLFSGIAIMIDKMTDVSLGLFFGWTLLVSFGATIILAACLISYDQWQGRE